MSGVVEVRQAVGEVYSELGAAADGKYAVVGEVTRSREVETAGDAEGAVIGSEVGQAVGRASLILNFGGRTRHGQAGVGCNSPDVRALELQDPAIQVAAAGQRMRGAVEVRQAVGQVHHQGTATAYRQRSIVREVPAGREICAAVDGEAATGSNGVEVRQRICVSCGVENLCRSARERDVRRTGDYPVAAGREFDRGVVGNVAAASQRARCAAKVGERAAGGNDIEYRPADCLHSAVVREILGIGLDVEHILPGTCVGNNGACLAVHQAHAGLANVPRAFNGIIVR